MLNDKKLKCCLNCVIFAVLLNLVLSQLAGLVATAEESNHLTSPSSLSIKGNVMKMLVHHRDTPVSSSIVVALVVFCACALGYCLPVLK